MDIFETPSFRSLPFDPKPHPEDLNLTLSPGFSLRSPLPLLGDITGGRISAPAGGEVLKEQFSRPAALGNQQGRPPAEGGQARPAVSSTGDNSKGKEPTALDLIGTGLELAIPEYFLGVCQHEGLHLLFAVMFGARAKSFNVLPSDKGGHFRFADAEWDGNLSPAQKTLVFLAPKFGDLLGLSVYAILDATDNIPQSKYAQLPLLLVATGMWIDFSKDIAATSDVSDVGRAYNLMGATTERARFPYRFVHGALALGTGIPLFRGYLRLFEKGSSTGESSGSKTGLVPLEGYVAGTEVGFRGNF